jgi:hypothetical protein
VVKRATLLAFAVVWAALMGWPTVTEWAAATERISGRVVDDRTGEGIAGAEVRIQASLTETARTGADGSFTIRTSRAAGETVYVAAGATEAGVAPSHINERVLATVGAAGVEIRLAPADMSDDPAYEFTSPQDCRLCHGAIYDYWQDSPHRNAAKNAWVLDMYDGSGTPGTGGRGFTYKGEHPELEGDCAECHAPMDSAKNPGDNTNMSELSAAAREYGVSCDVCHKTYEVTNIKLPGVQGMRFARGSRETIFGPLADAAPNFPGVMRASTSPLHTESRFCASCHEDNNDHDFDLDYLDEGSVASEETYSEWLASRYAVEGPGFASCQDCHMQPKGDTAMCEQYQPVERDPSQVYSHDFEGTTDAYVQNAASLRAIAQRAGDELRVAVAITNDRTGHDLPGGQAIRHAILLVAATDGGGRTLEFIPSRTGTVPEYGGVGDPALGYYAGLPGKGFAKLFARGAHEGVFFTEATSIASDNRIPAGATDWSSYVFELPEGFTPVRVEAKLVYRRAPRALVDEKGWTLTGHGRPNPDLVAPHFGVVMAADGGDVPMPGPVVDASRISRKAGAGLQLRAGEGAPFEPGARVEITDAVGQWQPFAGAARVGGGGTKLTQKGKIGGLNLNRYWQNGERRFLRVTNPDGTATVLYLERSGSRYVPVDL